MHQLAVVVFEGSLPVYILTCSGECWKSGVKANQRQTSTHLGGRDIDIQATGIQAVQAAAVSTARAAFLRPIRVIATPLKIALNTIVEAKTCNMKVSNLKLKIATGQGNYSCSPRTHLLFSSTHRNTKPVIM